MISAYLNMTTKFLISFFFIGIAITSSGQIIIAGSVIDTVTKEPLFFVNIGIKHKNIGTTSWKNGSFSLTIPKLYDNDTLTLSMVGYYELHVPIVNMIPGHSIFQLRRKPTELSLVTVMSKKMVERKFGIKTHNSIITFTDGSTNQNDIFEIGQLIKLGDEISKITSVIF